VITASTPGHIKQGWCKSGNVMAIRNAIVSCFVQLLLLAGLPVVTIVFADANEVRVQFCWAVGKFDHTIYFAEAEGHEDRQASFAELIEISGIDHHPIECRMLDSRSYRLLRADLIKKWSASEFELVNTTFLSDLDY
jgi:hypothetical protein